MAGELHSSRTFDVAIVGGGVVGCAVARRLTLAGASVVLLEKGSDILCGASKGNSAILHTGFDAPPGSLELECIQAGYAEYLAIRADLNLPLLETGAVLVAWSEQEGAALEDILAHAQENGVANVAPLSRADLLAREPALSGNAVAALLIPGEHIIDPWSAPLAYLTQALANGAAAHFSCEVVGGDFERGVWNLSTTRGEVAARWVINCAGLFGDRLEQSLIGDASFEIRPRKGQFLVFDKAASRLLRTTILPVPSERSKGIVVCRTIFGNVLVGPTAEEQESREDSSTDQRTLAALKLWAGAVVPGLSDVPVTAAYAGIRPATERKDYRIRFEPERCWLSLGGIRSTGLTAALGIAAHAEKLLANAGEQFGRLSRPITGRVPMLAECGSRDWTLPGHGDIVCHCELVTEREARAALGGALPARDLAGLKRRTRATMGRCQGFYCLARLSAMTAGRFEPPIATRAGHA